MAADAKRLAVMLAGGGVAPTSGGVGTLLLYLDAAWAARPDAPAMRVLDTRGPGGMADAARHFAHAAAVLAWLCLTGRAAVVHAHMTTRGSVARKVLLCGLATLLGAPTVIHQHGADFHEFFRRLPRPARTLIRMTLNRARRVIVLGAAWRDFLVGEVGVAPVKVALVANGVPLPSPAAAPGRGQPPRLLFLGRLGERKGVPELMAALATPRLLALPWQAVIAGDGDVARFRRLAAETGLDGRVQVLGWQGRDATETLLREADLLVLPSHHEALPMAVLEALAHAVPVLTTPVGVIPEYLTHGESAWIVPPGDAERLADALVALLQDPDRARIGRAGHAVFRERLSIDAVAGEIVALYRESGVHLAPAGPQ